MKTRKFLENMEGHVFHTEKVTGEGVNVVPLGIAVGAFSIINYDIEIAHEAKVASYEQRINDSMARLQATEKEASAERSRYLDGVSVAFAQARELNEQLILRKEKKGSFQKSDESDIKQLKGMVDVMCAFRCNVDEFKWIYLG